jgi:hypothetical protein
MEALRGHLEKFYSQVQKYMPDLNQEHHHRIGKEIGKQMSADEIVQHPEYPYVNWDLKAEKKGKVEVAKGRGGPFNVAYEIHGKGPKKLIVSLWLQLELWDEMLTLELSVDHGFGRVDEGVAETDQGFRSYSGG